MFAQTKTKNMQTLEKHPIIRGEFKPSDAKLILLNILNNKIKFHEMRNFSSIERYGIVDENVESSINRLKYIQSSIEKIIHEAEIEGKNLSINAELNIQIID